MSCSCTAGINISCEPVHTRSTVYICLQLMLRIMAACLRSSCLTVAKLTRHHSAEIGNEGEVAEQVKLLVIIGRFTHTQLLPPRSPACEQSSAGQFSVHRCDQLSPPLPDCIHFICFSPNMSRKCSHSDYNLSGQVARYPAIHWKIAEENADTSATTPDSAAAHRLCLPQLLLPNSVCFHCCSLVACCFALQPFWKVPGPSQCS